MPRTIALAVVSVVAFTAALQRQAVAQSFYEASNLLPPHLFDIAIGASVVDLNSDGRVDLFRRDRIYLQESDGTFTDVYEDMGLELLGGAAFGAIFGDVNNDGFIEVFLIDLDRSLPFYLGQDGLFFQEHSNDSGIRNVEVVQGSTFLDFNQDGLLDLFVGIDGGVPRLYRNIGLDFFQDVGPVSGFDYRYAYGVAAADFDNDGDADIMLTQCFPPPEEIYMENVLYRNDDGVFTAVSNELGILDDLPSWGVVWLDYDNDGLLDFYVGNVAVGSSQKPGTNTLYRNLGPAGFQNVTASAGVTRSVESQSIAVAAADFDNDGWIDLFVADAHEIQPALFRNNRDGSFTDVWPQLALPTVQSMAVAVGDVNGDGWIDIFQPSLESDQLLMNLGGQNHYLAISLRGTQSNHFAVGGRIDLYSGGLHQVRQITAGDGMTSQSDNFSAHFGLGEAVIVDSIVVRWPNGLVERFEGLAVDRHVTFVEGIGINEPPGSFDLLSPTGKAAVSPSVETLSFSWTAATDREDAVTYQFRVVGPGIDSTVSDLTNRQIVLDRSLFSEGEAYHWTATATDEHSVRAARYAEFVFGPTTATEPQTELPRQLRRLDVFPNPFAGTLRIHFELALSEEVEIDVFDVVGRRIARIYEGHLQVGSHRFDWTPLNPAPGTYFLRIKSPSWQTGRTVAVR